MNALRSTMSRLSVSHHQRRSAHGSAGRHLDANSLLRTFTLVGGTHGNELAGVYLVKNFAKKPHRTSDAALRIKYLVSNPRAVARNARYVDTDMNRCFSLADLERNTADLNVEQLRARELNKELGPKSKTEAAAEDFIMDLHNTTANTGILLCFHEEDGFSLELAAYLRGKNPSIRAAFWPPGDQPFLPTVARSGMTVEIGPVAHSTVDYSVMHQAKVVVEEAIRYFELHNANVRRHVEGESGPLKVIGSCYEAKDEEGIEVSLPMAHRVAHVPFPRDEVTGEITGFVHPHLQGIAELQEGSVLRKGDPILCNVEGEEVVFDPTQFGLKDEEVEEGVYPMFVNEAAYYEKDVAFYLTKLVHRTVRVIDDSSEDDFNTARL